MAKGFALEGLEIDYRDRSDTIESAIYQRHLAILANRDIIKLNSHPGTNYAITDLKTPVVSKGHINCLLLYVARGDSKLVYHLFPETLERILHARQVIYDFAKHGRVQTFFQSNPYAQYLEDRGGDHREFRISEIRKVERLFNIQDLTLEFYPIANFRFKNNDPIQRISSFTATVAEDEVCFWNDQNTRFLTSLNFVDITQES